MLGQLKALVARAATPMVIPPIVRRYVLCILKEISVNEMDISALS